MFSHVLHCCIPCEINAASMDFQRRQIVEITLYEFHLVSVSKKKKNICHDKGAAAVDHSTVTKWLKKCYSVCQQLEDLAKSGRAISVNTAALLLANLASTIQRVSGNLGVSKLSAFCHIQDLGKNSQCCRIGLRLIKILKNF